MYRPSVTRIYLEYDEYDHWDEEEDYDMDVIRWSILIRGVGRREILRQLGIQKDFNGQKKCLRGPYFVIFNSLFDSYWVKKQKSAPHLNSVTSLRWSLPTNFNFSYLWPVRNERKVKTFSKVSLKSYIYWVIHAYPK